MLGGPESAPRDATPEDAAGIARMHVDAWRAGYAHILPADALAALSVPQRTASWARALTKQASEDTGQWTLVADSEGEIVGFASGGPNRAPEPAGASELYGLYVAPSHWERGVGSRLIEASLERLREGGDELAVLWVLEDNERARRFYRRRGWSPDGGRQPVDLIDGAARSIEVRYRRRLEAPD